MACALTAISSPALVRAIGVGSKPSESPGRWWPVGVHLGLAWGVLPPENPCFPVMGFRAVGLVVG